MFRLQEAALHDASESFLPHTKAVVSTSRYLTPTTRLDTGGLAGTG